MKTGIIIFICFLTLAAAMVYGLQWWGNHHRPGRVLAQLRAHLAQKRDYLIYVGTPLDSPVEWKLAEVEGQILSLSGARTEIEDLTAFLVVYANGQVLQAERPFFPLPEGVGFFEERAEQRRDLLDLSELAEGEAFVKVSYGESASHPNDRSQYSTTIRNNSDTKLRVLKFGAFTKSADGYRLSTVSGDFFSDDEFISWYGAAKDGWITPGQTVMDPDNYGGGDGYWVYYFETESGKKFVAGGRIP
jgi:hypothetical protein